MKKIIFPIVAMVLTLACNNTSKQECEKSSHNENHTVQLKNYAVVWQWAVNDADMIREHLPSMNDEMLAMWKNGDIENAYYNANSEISIVENLPNISYFLRAESYRDARGLLNSLSTVKNGIATFSVFPVGTKWFGRNTEVIEQNGISKSYVSVWKTLQEIKQDENLELINTQANYIKSLYQQGNIENVYWELSGEPDAYKRRNNDITDFVFFINSNSKEEAKAICDSLPFTREGLVSYDLIPVGVFWLGNYEGE